MNGAPDDWLWRAATWHDVGVAVALSAVINAAFFVWMRAANVPSGALLGKPSLGGAAAVRETLRGLDANARRYDLLSTLTLDAVYPVVYAVALSLAIGTALRAHPGAPPVLRFVPFVAMVCDYAENTLIVLALTDRISVDSAAAPLAAFTAAKWAFVAASLLLVAFLWFV